MFSPRDRVWYRIPRVLVDIGADVSLVPRVLGAALLGRVRSKRRVNLGGVAPGARLTGYLHTLRLRVAGRDWRAPVVVASVDNVPVLLGRLGALDGFDVRFVRGRHMAFRSSR